MPNIQPENLLAWAINNYFEEYQEGRCNMLTFSNKPIQQPQVGKLFFEGKTSYPENRIFQILEGMPMIGFTIKSPTEEVIDNIQKGGFKLKICYIQGAIIFLVKFGDLEWMDIPYNVNLLQEQPADLPNIEPGNRLGTKVFLVDADTGILKVHRGVYLSAENTLKMKDYIEMQKQQPFDLDEYLFVLKKIKARYTTEDLIEMSKDAIHVIEPLFVYKDRTGKDSEI
jgi:hypothetical protein